MRQSVRRSGSIPASALFAAAILWTAYAEALHAQMGSDGGTSIRSQQQRRPRRCRRNVSARPGNTGSTSGCRRSNTGNTSGRRRTPA